MRVTKRRMARPSGSRRTTFVVSGVIIGAVLAVVLWYPFVRRASNGRVAVPASQPASQPARKSAATPIPAVPAAASSGGSQRAWPSSASHDGKASRAEESRRNVVAAVKTSVGGNRQLENDLISPIASGGQDEGSVTVEGQTFSRLSDVEMCNAVAESEQVGAIEKGDAAGPAGPSAGAFSYLNLPVITRADDFIDNVPSTPIPLPGTLRLPTVATAQELRKKGFQIRLFRLPAGPQKHIPTAWRYFEPCCVYISSVIRIPGSDKNEINISLDEEWLEPRKDGHIDNARWLLIFEQANDQEKIFRIDRAKMHEYFASGLYLEMTAAWQDGERAIKVLKSFRERQVNLGEDLDRRGRGVPCYRYQRIEVTGDRGGFPSVLGVLARCGAGSLLADAEGLLGGPPSWGGRSERELDVVLRSLP